MEEAVIYHEFLASKGPLPALIQDTNSCIIRPAEYFVAWQGVLTIAYQGFPPSLQNLKHNINTQLGGIITENPGSMWPKTSLACLRDNQVLSMTQLQHLRQICSDESLSFSEEDAVEVDKLCLVFYQCCCLEKTLMVTEFPLKGSIDFSEPLLSERQHVKSVLNDFAEENLHNYHSQVAKPGNRTAHYRNPKAGLTLICYLKKLPQSLRRFQERVEAVMPGMYDWFSHESIHITIRALL